MDGTPALEGMHVSIGQRVHTPAGRFSELFTRGTTVRVLGNANVNFDGESATVTEGGVALTTASQFPVHCSCATVSPVKDDKTRYTVQLEQKTVYVIVEEGDVLVKSQKKSKTVPSGKTVAVLCGAAAQEIVFAGGGVPVNVIAGSVAASAVAGPVINWKMNISGESPDH